MAFIRPHARAVAMLALLVSASAARATTIHGPTDIATLTRAADAVVLGRVVSVQSHWAAGGEKSGLIFTDIELFSIESWKGEAVPARIAVRNPGGVMGDLAQEVVGTPAFEPGEEVVVFLRLRAKAKAAGSSSMAAGSSSMAAGSSSTAADAASRVGAASTPAGTAWTNASAASREASSASTAAALGLPVYEVTRWALGKFSVGQANASLPLRALRNRAGVECIGCGPAEEDDLSLDELRSRVQAAVLLPSLDPRSRAVSPAAATRAPMNSNASPAAATGASEAPTTSETAPPETDAAKNSSGKASP